MRMVVVLPAPLGPRKPTISPRSTWKVTLSMAITGPKYFVRRWTLIMEASCAVAAVAGSPERPPTHFLSGRMTTCTSLNLLRSAEPASSVPPLPLASWHAGLYNTPRVLWDPRSSLALCAGGGVAPPERFAWHASEGRLFQAR